MERTLAIDFAGGAFGYRLRHSSGLKEALPRAAGFRMGRLPSVVDATAGLGRDAFMLAWLGARVTLIERSPEVFALLREDLARAATASPDLAAVVARMRLLHGDARDLLPSLRAEVVIVDPMHPPRRKSALVKMKMRLLRDLVGSDSDALELMKVALATPAHRIVLKWPKSAPRMEGLPDPSHEIIGKTVRYEVFMTQTASPEGKDPSPLHEASTPLTNRRIFEPPR